VIIGSDNITCGKRPSQEHHLHSLLWAAHMSPFLKAFYLFITPCLLATDTHRAFVPPHCATPSTTCACMSCIKAPTRPPTNHYHTRTHRSDRRAVSTRDLIESFGADFTGQLQHDVQEFMRAMFDELSRQVSAETNAPPVHVRFHKHT
jgi:hypothetical protein